MATSRFQIFRLMGTVDNGNGDDLWSELGSLRNVPCAPKSASEKLEAVLAEEGTYRRPPKTFRRQYNLRCCCQTTHPQFRAGQSYNLLLPFPYCMTTKSSEARIVQDGDWFWSMPNCAASEMYSVVSERQRKWIEDSHGHSNATRTSQQRCHNINDNVLAYGLEQLATTNVAI
jgi:hypothetical protein